MVSAAAVSCEAKGVACMTSAACEVARGEVHPLGVCAAHSAHVCCVVGVRPALIDAADAAAVALAKKKNNALAASRKRQFGGLLGDIFNTVNTVKNVVNGVMMLSNLANGLSTLNNAANAVNMLANAVPTLPSLPTVPPLPPITVPQFTVPPVPDYTIPPVPVVLSSLPPATLPGPRTNPNTGLPIGVDQNNPLGLATNAAGQFVNEHGVVVDRYGDLPKQQTNPSYVGVSQLPQFTTQPVLQATQPNNAVPGGAISSEDGDQQLGGTMADSDSGLGVGAYVGIGVVGLVCVVLLCVMVYCVASRSRDSTTYNVKNSSYDPQQSAAGGAVAWGVPMSNQFGAFNQQNSGMSFNQQNSGMSFNNNNQAMNFAAGGNFNTHTSFVSAADLPSPSGALRRDTNNAGYGIGVAASTTGTQNFNGGGATGAMPTFACPHCSKLYFYQSDVDSHVAARHDAHGF